jgi:hypothetical protein
MKRSLALSIRTLLSLAFAAVYLFCGAVAAAQTRAYDFNDSHFHLTNNIQEGPDIRDFLNMMSDKAGRVAVSGVPLQPDNRPACCFRKRWAPSRQRNGDHRSEEAEPKSKQLG